MNYHIAKAATPRPSPDTSYGALPPHETPQFTQLPHTTSFTDRNHAPSRTTPNPLHNPWYTRLRGVRGVHDQQRHSGQNEPEDAEEEYRCHEGWNEGRGQGDQGGELR